MHFGIGSPQFLVRSQVDGVRDAPWCDAVEDAVEYQWSVLLMRLVSRSQGNLSGPGKPQPAHIGGIDLLERAVALLGPVRAVGDPFFTARASCLQKGVIDPPRLLGQADQGPH